MPNLGRNVSNTHHFVLCNSHFNVSRNVRPVICLVHIDDMLNIQLSILAPDPFLFDFQFFFCQHIFLWIIFVRFVVNQARIEAVVVFGKANAFYHCSTSEHKLICQSPGNLSSFFFHSFYQFTDPLLLRFRAILCLHLFSPVCNGLVMILITGPVPFFKAFSNKLGQVHFKILVNCNNFFFTRRNGVVLLVESLDGLR